MLHRRVLLAGILLLASVFALPCQHKVEASIRRDVWRQKSDGAAQRPAPTDLNLLSLEVSALLRLYHFDFTRNQLETIRGMAKDTMQKSRARQAAKAGSKFAKALTDLREALLAGNDDQIADLTEKLDELAESDKPTLDEDIDVTDTARQRADSVFKMLSARQVANYVASNAESFSDPIEALLEAADDGRSVKGNDWKEFRDDTVGEISELVAGLNAAEAKKLHPKLAAWLDKTHKLSAAEFQAQRADLEKEVRKMLGDVNPLKVMRNVLDRDIAELLSNPQLAAAVELRMKTMKP